MINPQKRYRLVIADPVGRYSESEFTATEDEALAQARRELDQGASYVRVDTDVDHLHRTCTPVAEMRMASSSRRVTSNGSDSPST